MLFREGEVFEQLRGPGIRNAIFRGSVPLRLSKAGGNKSRRGRSVNNKFLHPSEPAQA